MVLTVPFEMSAVNLLQSHWRDHIPVLAVCLVCTALFILICLFAVGTYGEVEFWLSGGKVVPIFILFFFTFITMGGGNPQHDVYGFRYWKNHGAFVNLHAIEVYVEMEEEMPTTFWREVLRLIDPRCLIRRLKSRYSNAC